MPIRVIAGEAKGRKLKLVPGDTTRPVMDRVKEALFSILGRDIIDATFLDLFAGTGSVGIEALSRGASHVLFVDLERIAVKTIQENLGITRLADRATVRRADAFAVLRATPDQPYDYIYVAPPQYRTLWRDALLALEANPAWIPPGTTVITQVDPAEYKQPPDLKRLMLEDERRYGKTLLLFYRATPDSTDESSDEDGER